MIASSDCCWRWSRCWRRDGARAEPMRRPRAACSKPPGSARNAISGIEQALNNARYHELGGGYSLGMVLCWLGPNSETQILFLVAPKTGGRPQLLRFEEWRDKTFVADRRRCRCRTTTPRRKTLTSYAARAAASGDCGTRRRMELDRQGIQA